MNIVVIIKQVPDSEALIEIRPDGSGLEIEKKYELNYFDELAIEEALNIKEQAGGGVTLVTLGPQSSIDALRKGIAMGADDAIHLDDPAFEGGDGFCTAKILARAIEKIDYDLILAGRKATDEDAAEVGPMVAEFLGIPHVSAIIGLELSEDHRSMVVEREIEGGKEILRCSLPVLLTAQKGLNEPRIATVQGMMRAMKTSPKTISASELEFKSDEVGSLGAMEKVICFHPPPKRNSVKIIEGDGAEEKGKELLRILREDAKVI